MRLGFFLREALRALRRNAVPSFAAMATVLVTVLVLGVFIPVVQATTGARTRSARKVIADVYLKTDATKADIERVRENIENETPGVGRVQFISKEEALREERKPAAASTTTCWAPTRCPTFRVTPTRPTTSTKVRDALAPVAPSGERTVVDRRSTRSATARRTRRRSSRPRAS